MNILLGLLVAGVLIGGAVQWRRNVIRLRAANKVLRSRLGTAEAIAEARLAASTCPSCRRAFAEWEREAAE